MNREEVAEKIRSDAELQIALDDRIHDRFATMASQVNNKGIEAQLRWLEENCHESSKSTLDSFIKEREEA